MFTRCGWSVGGTPFPLSDTQEKGVQRLIAQVVASAHAARTMSATGLLGVASAADKFAPLSLTTIERGIGAPFKRAKEPPKADEDIILRPPDSPGLRLEALSHGLRKEGLNRMPLNPS
jgi:hypothetical protein